jgi:quercetin dioxygenase-like cupin family protein
MMRKNIFEALRYSDENVVIDELMSTPYAKEVRIGLQRNQVMRDHATPHPITLHVVEGVLKLTLDEDENVIKRGDIMLLEANTVHHMEAVEDSIIRLTLFSCIGDA